MSDHEQLKVGHVEQDLDRPESAAEGLMGNCKFLKNCWYAAGFSQEVTTNPMSRKLLDIPMVLYRTESGQPVALHDVCPHRFASLHKGKVFGEDIRCPYHGLRFSPSGKCVHNPIGTGAVPPKARVSSFPLREVDGIVWLWFGDYAAKHGEIVRFKTFSRPDSWATVQGYLAVKSCYTLVSDNLLDLSHAEFLHPKLASEGMNKRVKQTVTVEGDQVTAISKRPKEPTSKLFQASFGSDPPEFVEQRSIVRWNPPAVLEVEIGATTIDRPVQQGVTTVTAHLITPETFETCHYFWKIARDFKIDDGAFSETLFKAANEAYSTEDRPIIEDQQRNIGNRAFFSMKPMLLNSDAAAVRARRILEKRIEAQNVAITS